MDTFKTRILAMSSSERDKLAASAGTTRGLLNQIIFGGKQIELGLADCLVALMPGVRLETLPLTERARKQHGVRTGVSKKRRPTATTAGA